MSTFLADCVVPRLYLILYAVPFPFYGERMSVSALRCEWMYCDHLGSLILVAVMCVLCSHVAHTRNRKTLVEQDNSRLRGQPTNTGSVPQRTQNTAGFSPVMG